MIAFRRIAKIQTLAVFLVLCASMAFSQTTTASISGTVKDMSGAVLPGAQVVILNQDTGASRTVAADTAGRYLAGSLPLGNYRVTATRDGFQTMTRTGIALTVGQEAVVELTLAVGASTQTVEVTGEASAVETTTASVSALVGSTQIQNLPLNGRSLTDLALLTPGVMYNRTTGNSQGDGFGPRVSISGGRNESNLYLIDGTVANDRTGSTATTSGDTLGVEGVREFRIISHNFPAEYGRNSAGVVSMVTRSGTNQFHGSLYEFVRNNKFDARDFFSQTSEPPFKRNQFGGSIGGPVKKDRIFFFFNYEGLRQRAAQSFVDTVPDQNARNGSLPDPITHVLKNVGVSPLIAPYLNNTTLWPLPNGQLFGDGTGIYNVQAVVPTTDNYWLQRGDFHLSEKDNVSLRYIFNPSHRLRLQPLPNFARPDEATHHYTMLSETHIFSANAVNDFRTGFNRTTLDSASAPLFSLPSSFAFDPNQDPSLGMGDFNFSQGAGSTGGALTLVGSKNGITQNYNNSFEYTDSFSWIRGAHALKFGAGFIRTQQNINSIPGGGEYTFTSLANLLAATPSQLTGNTHPPGLTTERGFREGLLGYYVQDDYRVRSNLTLNLGLRFEYQLDRQEVNGLGGSFLLTGPQALTPIPGPVEHFAKLNFAPRFGLAWDPTGDGKTSVRLGVGVFHDQITGSVLPATPNTLATNTAFSIKSNVSFPHGFPPNTNPKNATSIATSQWPLPTPTSIHFGLDLQRQLTPTISARLGYVGTYSYNLTRFTQQNIATPTIQNGQPFWNVGAPLLYPGIGDISELVADSHANYNALQVGLQKAVGRGLMFGVSYTWSKTLSDEDSVTNRAIDNAGPYTALDNANPGRDYGLSGYDQRHTFVINAQYQLPFDQYLKNAVVKGVLGGWTVKAIWNYGSGMPVDIFMGYNASRSGATGSAERPNLILGVPVTSGVTAGCAGIPAGQQIGTPNLWFNPCAFGSPTPGTWGNLGRDTVPGPNFDVLNAALAKEFRITEKIKVEFRAEAFNLANHPSFGLVQGSVFTGPGVHAGNEGTITTTVSNSRQIQLGARLVF